jgi:hypothetical protein
MDYVNAKSADLSDEAATQSSALQIAIAALRQQLQNEIAALTASELEAYNITQGIELENLQDLSAAL